MDDPYRTAAPRVDGEPTTETRIIAPVSKAHPLDWVIFALIAAMVLWAGTGH